MNIVKEGKNITFFLLVSASLISGHAYSEVTEPSNIDSNNPLEYLLQKHPVYKFTLPVNEAQHISINITVPEELIFKYQRPNNPYFIQYGDENTVFSISSSRGEKLQAPDLIEKGLNVMKSNAQVTILDKADNTYSGYVDGYRILKYFDPKRNDTELMYFYVASGPYDSVSILYAKKIKESDKLKKVLKNLKKGFKANVNLVDKDFKH